MDPLIGQSIAKRFQTTMIGALDQFEKHFGYLWGHDLSDDKLTDNHLYFQDKWDFVRNNILNNGNNQMRKTLKELSSIIEPKTQYHYKFHHKKGQIDNEDKSI